MPKKAPGADAPAKAPKGEKPATTEPKPRASRIVTGLAMSPAEIAKVNAHVKKTGRSFAAWCADLVRSEVGLPIETAEPAAKGGN